MTKKYPDPSPPQGELNLGPFALTSPKYAYEPLKGADCIGGTAQRLSQDQYRCATCGVVWDVDEPRPPCLTATAPKE